MGPVPEQLLEEVGALPSAAVFTPPAGSSPQEHTAAGGNIINSLPDVWGELDAIDHLILASTSNFGIATSLEIDSFFLRKNYLRPLFPQNHRCFAGIPKPLS
uniref:Uncharacterized protein n=1 Tax=Timema bartmani TaxID=61472 RepID=A0A7R9FC98_9NEOP|nr:unnamed protein product [Timema bartmani]